MNKRDENVRQWLNGQLLGNEYVLWEGQCVNGKWFHKSDLYRIPFSLIWCGFAIFWELNAIKTGRTFFILWGVPFVAVGLYIVFGRFIYQQAVKKHTYYAVTSRRILRYQNRRTDFLLLDKIPSVNKSINPDGTGTITFGQEPYPASLSFFSNARSSGGAQGIPIYLEDIPEADKVYRLITEQMMQERGVR